MIEYDVSDALNYDNARITSLSIKTYFLKIDIAPLALMHAKTEVLKNVLF